MPDVGTDTSRPDAYQDLVVPTAGSSMSLSVSTSAEPYLSWVMAFIGFS
jgi:hypothetical protein